MSWFISLLVALMLALLTNYSGMEVFDTLADFVTPFLWGFGLDQFKNSALRFPALVSAVPMSGRTAMSPPAAQGQTAAQ